MHIPDGFITPKMYLPAYTIAAGLWIYGARRVKTRLNERAIPLVAVVTALVFVLMMIVVPLPGGTSAHATGIGILAVLFGVWVSFLSVSMVLLIQALLFGIGGVTALPIGALAMGLVGGAAALTGYSSLHRLNERAALFTAGWLSVALPALVLAAALGLQPALAHREDGTPLFFPFGLEITLPAVVLPHLLIGIPEGLLTVFVYGLITRLRGRSANGSTWRTP
ncbi:MAG: energy-coupling factor ABC transporter permease [Candidatus Latescibacterota bacterium]|nr:MAG: energy-coupling factor ABC transporter permease [Candidatus Latescibacterota bacterium]